MNMAGGCLFPSETEVKKMDVRPGDTLVMKKTHPCGVKEFLVLRSGMDFKIRCTTCGHEVMVPRLKCEKNIRRILRDGEEIRP